ncbi:hypothetical protein [Streptomyces sp. Tue6028]|uniref:hypothetical protein n=1 Tax=Streptomyces sp. Tue6028 TaxID=2036037 RepID=UPI003EB7BB22
MTDPGTPSTGGRRSATGPTAWFRRQEPAVKAAVIGLVGTLSAALLAAVVTVTVALSRPSGAGAAPDTGSPRPSSPEERQSTAPGGPSSPSSASPSRSSASPVPPSSTTPSAPAASPSADLPSHTPVPAPARARWRGTLILDGSAGVRGWFLDAVPPDRAPVGDLAIRAPREVYGNALAAWPGPGTPGRQQCSDLLGTQLGRRQLDVQEGDMGCFTTEGGRVGFFRVSGIPDPDHITVEATVWEQG